MLKLSSYSNAQGGVVKTRAVLRHLTPLMCAVGGVAFELFLKYHGLNHPPPEMKDRTWYNLPLVSAGLPTQAVTYKVTVFCFLTNLLGETLPETIISSLMYMIMCADSK